MDEKRIRSVTIVGGGTAGWMAAAVLARTFGRTDMRIRLVESEAIGTVGVGEATIPPILTLNALLGIDEDALIAATGATMKLGIAFHDWGAIGERYFHPFGPFGADLHGVPFHQHWLRDRAAPIAAHSLVSMAAAAGRFVRPSDDPRHVHSRMAYALHFDAVRYAAFLRARAEADGVERIEGRIVGVEQDARGHVSTLRLEDGRVVDGELFIDCSGFVGLLIERTLKTGYEDWSHWLPMDRAVAVPTAAAGPPPPYTRATARRAGWHWRIPLQHRVGNGHVYASAHVSDDAALDDLLGHIGEAPLADPRVLRFTTGRRRLAWNGNVVALGLASGFVEPLESTSIHLVQRGITTLMTYFPDRDFAGPDRDAYNRLMQTEFEGVRDFIILHYHLTRRDDSPFWDHVRAMRVPDSLAERIALFASRGRLNLAPEELFREPSWVAVMLGQGLWPAANDPALAAHEPADIAAQMARMRDLVTRGVAAMPAHADFLADPARQERAA